MPTLLDNAPQSLSAASARLQELRHRALQMVEWFVALVVLGVVLWLNGSLQLAGSVAAGAVTAVVIGGLAVDERRRLLLSLVAQGDANSISEVRSLADRLVNDPAQRRRVAASLRTAARADRPGGRGPIVVVPGLVVPGRVARYAPRLLALADAIADERSTVSPPAVALCQRLLTDGVGSPLYNPQLSDRELDRVLAVVEAGVTPAAAAERALVAGR